MNAGDRPPGREARLPFPDDDRYRDLEDGLCFDERLRRCVLRRRGSAAVLLPEARLLAALDHPGAPTVYDVELLGDEAAVTMRPAEGHSLVERTRLSRAAILDVLGRVAETLARAHSLGLAHGSLSPACVVLESYGRVTLTGWGIGGTSDDLRATGELVAAMLGDAGEPGPLHAIAARLRDGSIRSFEALLAELAGDSGEALPIVRWAQGEAVLAEGAESDLALQILEGEVEISVRAANGRVVVGRRGPGDVIGELGLLSGAPRTATATALTPTVARALTADRVEQGLARTHPLVARLVRSLSDRLVEAMRVARTGPATPQAHGRGGLHREATPPSSAAPSRPPQSVAAPQEVGGPRYAVLEELGAGAFGRVSRCVDHRLGRIIARKQAHVAGRAGIERMAREARLVASLDHPGVAPVYGLDGASYDMKALEGASLRARMGRPMPVAEAIRVFTRIAETLACAHDRGVLHLDLKPDNVMLGAFGEVWVIDWGCAHASAEASARQGAGGTHRYMPVEQVTEPRSALGPPADVFAAGVLLYEMLAAALPWADEGTLLQRAYLRLTVPPRPLASRRPEVSPRLAGLCHRMISPRPEDRTPDFHTVVAELRSLTDLGETLPERELAAGEVLFREGEAGTLVYVVARGVLDVSIGRRVLATRGPGEIIGELALLSEQPRIATVTARTPAVVQELSPEALEVELEKLDPLVASVVRGLAHRLREDAVRVAECPTELP